MQTKNQKKRVGFISLSVALLLSFVIVSCTKSDQVSPLQDTEAATNNTKENGASTYQGQQSSLFNETLWIPCANNGAGEYVTFDGYIHSTYKTTVNDNHYSIISHINLNEVSGIGLTTGDKYVATGEGNAIYNGSINNGQTIASGTTRFTYTTAGGGNNLTIVFKAQLVVNANGEVLSERFDAINTCK